MSCSSSRKNLGGWPLMKSHRGCLMDASRHACGGHLLLVQLVTWLSAVNILVCANWGCCDLFVIWLNLTHAGRNCLWYVPHWGFRGEVWVWPIWSMIAWFDAWCVSSVWRQYQVAQTIQSWQRRVCHSVYNIATQRTPAIGVLIFSNMEAYNTTLLGLVWFKEAHICQYTQKNSSSIRRGTSCNWWLVVYNGANDHFGCVCTAKRWRDI
jgi:hypothetical protein